MTEKNIYQLSNYEQYKQTFPALKPRKKLFRKSREDEESNDYDGIKYTNKVDVYSFGITLIFIVNDSYAKFSLKNASNGVIPALPKSITSWVHKLIVRCLSPSPDERPSFAEIFEIMKSNNYDLFNEKCSKLTSKQKQMKSDIEKRILKIEAFEYQHRDD